MEPVKLLLSIMSSCKLKIFSISCGNPPTMLFRDNLRMVSERRSAISEGIVEETELLDKSSVSKNVNTRISFGIVPTRLTPSGDDEFGSRGGEQRNTQL